MIVLSGAALVLPDRILSPGTLVIDDGRIAEIRPDAPSASHPQSHVRLPRPLHRARVHRRARARRRRRRLAGRRATRLSVDRRAAAAVRRHRVLPDDRRVRARRAAARARSGPACARDAGAARRAGAAGASREQLHQPRVPGAQPSAASRACALRSSRWVRWVRWVGVGSARSGGSGEVGWGRVSGSGARVHGADILAEIERAAPDVGHRHACAGARWRARSDSLAHRARPSRVARPFRRDLRRGARRHRRRRAARDAPVQPHAAARPPRARACRAPCCRPTRSPRRSSATAFTCIRRSSAPRSPPKRPSRVMAITDATAAAGLPAGTRATLGGQPIIAGEATALLADGTLAGSIV